MMQADAAAVLEDADRQVVEAFVFREARLADEHRYEEWEALWADEALYWVPIGDNPDPERQVSYIYDNRARLASRIRQLRTGRRHSQSPPSRLRRVVSNIEIQGSADAPEVVSNFLLVESRRGVLTTWAGQTVHRLKRQADGYRIAAKTVRLVNSTEAIPNLAFLI